MWVGSIPRVLSAVVAFPMAFLDSTVATVCRMIFSPKAFMLFGCSVFRAAPGCWLPQLSSLSLPAAFSKRLSRPKRPYVVNSLPQGFLAALPCCASLGRCPLNIRWSVFLVQTNIVHHIVPFPGKIFQNKGLHV